MYTYNYIELFTTDKVKDAITLTLANFMMRSKKKPNFKYSTRIEISFIIVLLGLISLFYFYPELSRKPTQMERSSGPEIIVINIPKTTQTQLKKRTKPFVSKIIVPRKEQDISDPIDSTLAEVDVLPDTSLFKILYAYKHLLTPLLQDFNPESISKKNSHPLASYSLYLKNRLLSVNKVKNINVPSAAEDYLNKRMGRSPGMIGLSFPIATAVKHASGIFKQKKKKGELAYKNIIDCEPHFDIIFCLWESNQQTIFELYENEEICEKTTIQTLQKSLNQLCSNGLVEPVINEDETLVYSFVYSSDEMIDQVNKFIFQNKENSDLVNKLNLILHLLIQNTS